MFDINSLKSAFGLVVIVFLLIAVFFVLPNVWIQENSNKLTIAFSYMVAIATLAYAYLTKTLVEETARMREAQTRPHISVIIEPTEEWINFIVLRIRNDGLGPAYNVRFQVLADFEYMKGKKLSEMSLIKKGMSYIASKQEAHFFLTSLVEDYEKKKVPFSLKVSYQDAPAGKLYTELFTFDFSELEDMMQLGEPPLHKIAKEIEGIHNELRSITGGHHRLETVVYSQKDVEKEKKIQLKKMKEWMEKSKRQIAANKSNPTKRT